MNKTNVEIEFKLKRNYNFKSYNVLSACYVPSTRLFTYILPFHLYNKTPIYR